MTDSADEAASDLVERWLTKAAEDLGAATVLLDNPLVARWAVCFHAQQAAEKALKAILVQSSIEFPRKAFPRAAFPADSRCSGRAHRPRVADSAHSVGSRRSIPGRHSHPIGSTRR